MHQRSAPLHPKPPEIDPAATGTRPPRYAWSEQELALLNELSGMSLDDDEIARRLGRTRRAVRTMILRTGGKALREARQGWSEAELATVARLHAAGMTCNTIADSLPGRSPLAVFRKLCRLVGPAPSAVAKRTKKRRAPPVAEVMSAPPVAEVRPAPEAPIRLPVRFVPPPPPTEPLPATVDAMVRWLRSRDYVVLARNDGWQVDHHRLGDTGALVDFVNLRRVRLRLQPFTLIEPEIIAVPMVCQSLRSRRWAHG